MLGQETLLEAVANSFGQKIFINKDGLSRYLADLEVVASDFWTSDSESTRFEVRLNSCQLRTLSRVTPLSQSFSSCKFGLNDQPIVSGA